MSNAIPRFALTEVALRIALPADWAERQRAFVEERELSRAEQCRCGHDRGAHMEDKAHCHACRCCSFDNVIKTQQEGPYGC
jgi:hypothetical protein